MKMHTTYYVRVTDNSGAWVLRWPNGSPRKFKTFDAAHRCLRYLPVAIAQSAQVLPVVRY
jgi:hypothetical protein